MDKLKTTARSARNAVAERTSVNPGSASLSVPQSSLPPEDNASTTAVNEGVLGPQPGMAARDFAVSMEQPVQQPTIQPPTSLQSSVDAGTPVAGPQPTPSAVQDGSRLPVPGRGRSNSAPRQLARPQIGGRQSSIGIRRMPSAQSLQAVAAEPSTTRLACVDEDGGELQVPTSTTGPAISSSSSDEQNKQPTGRLRRASDVVKNVLGLKKEKNQEDDVEAGAVPMRPTTPGFISPLQDRDANYTSNMVDVLDTIDPEVQTLTSLTNVQNSLFIPNLGRFVNRRPTYTLRQAPSERASREQINNILYPVRETRAEEQPAPAPAPLSRTETTGTVATLATIDSHLSESRFAVLPHGASLEGWSKEDKQELNDHVRHMLHSKRSKFKRSMRGFGHYIRRPLGFLVTLYATLITLFGLAWVLFLIGWINVGGRQLYIINIIDNVLVGLFAIVGDGLAPFRAVDTYHMIYIAHYHHFTWSLRKKDRLPELQDHNDLPASNVPMAGTPDSVPEDPEKRFEFTVLTPEQQKKLEHHENKFCKSHSFYKPHETETHYAFPLRLLVAIVVLLDFHSIFQIALGACTWSIYYKVRPMALTTVILCCSIACNATAGLVILIGDRKTRKKDVLERMNRQELTEMAIQKVEKRREKESESEREDNETPGEGKQKGRRSIDIFRHGGETSAHHSPHHSHGSLIRHGDKKDEEKVQSAYP